MVKLPWCPCGAARPEPRKPAAKTAVRDSTGASVSAIGSIVDLDNKVATQAGYLMGSLAGIFWVPRHGLGIGLRG